MRAQLVLLAIAAACGPAFSGGDRPPDAEPSSPRDAGVPYDARDLDHGDFLYAHSRSVLYRLHPVTLEATVVGPFAGDFAGAMTDIAIDRDGNVFGVGWGAVYAVDPGSAWCDLLAPLNADLNALTFIAGGPGSDSPEVLVGASASGNLYRIDPATGATELVGHLGDGMRSSGDLVSVSGFGTVGTVLVDNVEVLASIDPETGAATPIGPTGFHGTYGLAFWGGVVYGFTDQHEVVAVDPATGAGALIDTSEVRWWGAGVKTSAPVIR